MSPRILVVTGAGLSAAAGLPTYRGSGGIYPTGVIPLHATDATSSNLPALWQRILPLADAARATEPTPAHTVFAEMEAWAGVTVVTQNVDGFHEAAGSSVVHAMHGSLASVRCLAAGTRHRARLPGVDVFAGAAAVGDVPRCPYDNSRLRPDVVLFDERLDTTTVRAATAAARDADVVIVAGSSLQVHPVAGFVTTALDAGAVGFWCDLDPVAALADVDDLDRASFTRLRPVPGDVQDTVPALVEAVRADWDDDWVQEPEPAPCGHPVMERGCGGCDPSAIDLVLTDDGVLRPFDPAHDLATGQHA